MFPGSYVPQIYMAYNGNMTKGPMFQGAMLPSSRYVFSQGLMFPRST